MANFRLEMLPLNLLALIGLIAWGASASSPRADEATPSPSPSAEVELICHTDNPADCYPKVFQPTHEFQVVHDDQDLPHGLHVRLDVSTGRKEAKINVPDETDPALEGLPVDQSIVLVDRDEAGSDASSQDQAGLPPNAPAYDPAGKIKTPKSASDGEGSAFYRSLTILKKGLDVDAALEMLEDISHDIYYGLKIAEDYDTVHELFCLSSYPPPAEEGTRARLAALTLSSTVQNNPKALAEIEQHWTKLLASRCRSSSTTPLGEAIFTLFPPSQSPPPPSNTDTDTAASAALTKARVSLLSGLLKSPLLRRAFLHQGGPAHLVRLLTHPSTLTEAWAPAQRAAAFLLTDNFLDPDMGAAAGEWPTRAALPDGECAARQGGEAEEEGCLDWHVRRIATQNKGVGDHWSHDLRVKLARYRKAEAADGNARGGYREKVDL